MNGARIFDGEVMTIVGRRERYAVSDASRHIPMRWAWFGPMMDGIAGRDGADTYGLCLHGGGAEMTYVCGVRTNGAGAPTDDLTTVVVPALRYACFTHHGPVSDIAKTVELVMGEGLRTLDVALLRGAGVPDLVEHYGPDFNLQSSLGSIELWVPVAKLA